MDRIRGKLVWLLLILEHPEIPLTNNLSERDIRECAMKRKISVGTRNDLGRRCRDTFLSLKKTCRKLGVSFCRFVQDRIQSLLAIRRWQKSPAKPPRQKTDRSGTLKRPSLPCPPNRRQMTPTASGRFTAF